MSFVSKMLLEYILPTKSMNKIRKAVVCCMKSTSTMSCHQHSGKMLPVIIVTTCTLSIAVFLLVFDHNSTSSGRQEDCPGTPRSAAAVAAAGDRTWRQTNRLTIEYRPDVRRRLSELIERRARSNDSQLVRFARDLIDPMPRSALTFGLKRSRNLVTTPQALKVEQLTNRKVQFNSI